MSWWKLVIAGVIALVLGAGIYGLINEKNNLEKKAAGFRAEFEGLEKENKELSARIKYFENPENLLKEIKSQFNYREQGEGLIIIVPRD